MKKFILVCFLILLPLKVYATDISNASISGPAQVTEGEKISLDFIIKFSGLDKTDIKSKGVFNIAFEFEVSNDDLVADSFLTDFDTIIIKDQSSGRYVVYSEVQDGIENTCLDNYLLCGDYKLRVTFKAQSTNQSSVIVKYNEIEAAVLPVELDDIKPENAEVINSFNRFSHTISIIKSEVEVPASEVSSQIETKPSDEFENSIPTVKPKENAKAMTPAASTPSSKTEAKKSSNNYLKDLKIKNYNIDFNKEITSYTVNIEESVNSLELILELDDKKSKYDIIGADNLRENEYKVLIDVTSENGSKKTYIINAEIADKNASINTDNNKIKVFGKEIDKKYIKYSILGLIVIVVLIIIKAICSIFKEKVGNRKVKKILKEIEKK